LTLIRYYKKQALIQNENLNNFLDEICRLRNLLATIKSNGGLKGIEGLDEDLLNSIKEDRGMFGDDAITLSS
jgi:hypothetical protein